jgi:hypothetical protein
VLLGHIADYRAEPDEVLTLEEAAKQLKAWQRSRLIWVAWLVPIALVCSILVAVFKNPYSVMIFGMLAWGASALACQKFALTMLPGYVWFFRLGHQFSVLLIEAIFPVRAAAFFWSVFCAVPQLD